MLPVDESPDAIPRGLIITILVLFIAVIVAGVFFYQSQEQQIRNGEIKDLTSIALLKADRIAEWRQSRLYDAQVISSSTFFSDGVDRYLTSGDAESRNKILERFSEMNVSPYYDNVLLVDPDGIVRLSLNPSVTSVHPSVIDQLNVSLHNGEAALTDLHQASDTRRAHLYLIAPLTVMRGDRREPVGAVVYSINPDDFLYPLIRSWPVPSGSAETLLIEREGDHVLFLNELRHQNNTALNLTIPLTQTDIPAVMAVLGATGAFEGRDYRQVNVISVLEPVPGSPWFIVAKIDTEEAFSAWRSHSVLIIVLVAGTLAGAIIIAGLVWQRRQKYYYRRLYAAEAEKNREEQKNRERFETLLHLAEMESATERELADFVLDAGCRLTHSPLAFMGVISADESVFAFTAWSGSAIPDYSIAASPFRLPIEKAGIWAEAVRNRKPLIVNDYPASPSGKNELPFGHVPITRFVSVPIFEDQKIVMACAVANRETDYSAADADNLNLLMQGVWNHLRKRSADEALRQKNADLEAAYEKITASDEELAANYDELARSEKALAESERKYRNLYQYAQVGLFETSLNNATVIACNERYATLAGFPSIKEAIGKDILHLYADADDRTEVSRILKEKGSIENHTVKFRNPHTGTIFWGQFTARYNYERDVAEGSIIDITAQKDAETKIQNSRNFLDSIIEQSPNPLWISDERGMLIRLNTACSRMLKITPDEVVGKYNIFKDSIVESQGKMPLVRSVFEEGESVNFDLEYDSVLLASPALEHHAKLSLNVTIFPVKDSTGKITNAVIQFLDFTDRKMAEEALRESETRLRKILKKAPVPLCYLNKDGVFTFRNERFVQVFGYTADDVSTIAEWWQKAYPDEEYRQRVIATWDAAVRLAADKGTDIAAVEYRVTCKDKKERIIEISGITLNDDLLVMFVDLTDRKRAEAELAATQLKYRELFENVSIGILRSTPGPEGTIIEANPAALRIFEADSREQFFAVHPGELYQDTDQRAKISDEILASGAIEGMEIRFKTLKGRAIWGRITATKKTAENGGIYFDKTIEEITGRKLAEFRLQASLAEAQRFREALDHVPAYIYMKDPQSRYVYANQSALELFAVSAGELAGSDDTRFFPPDTAKRLLEIDSRVFSGEQTKEEIDIAGADGQRRVYWEVKAPIYAEPGSTTIWGLMGISTDITESKKAEERLYETNEYLHNLLDYANAPIIVWDPAFRITRFNHAFEDITGRTEQDVVGQNLAILFPETSRNASLELIQKTLDGERWEVVEIPIQCISGEIRIVLWNSANIVDSYGTIISTIAQGQDITDRKLVENALKESEEKYRELFENITSGFALHEIILDDNGKPIDYRFLMVNTAFERMTGLEGAAIINRTVSDVLPGTEPYWIEIYGRVALTGKPERFENFSSELNRWYEVLVYRPKQGQFATVFTDITEHRRAEKALFESEKKFRDMVLNLDEGFYSCTMEGVLLEHNPAFIRIFGIKPHRDMRGEHLPDFWQDAGDRQEYGHELNRQGFVRNRVVNAKKQNEEKIVVIANAHIVPDEKGTPLRIEGTFLDITGLKRAEEQLKTSETRYRRLFESAKDGILILNRDTGEFIDANPFIETLIGYSKEELMGKHLWDIGFFKDQLLSKIAFDELKKKEYLRYENLPLETKDGQVKEVEFVSNVYPINHHSVIQCNIRDITDRKAMEHQREALIKELEQKNAELERFTYTVSHDLKSPLITIRGFAGLLEDDALKGDQLLLKKDIRRILEAAATMQALLADLLELSRIGRIVNPPEKTSFGRIVHEAVDLLAGSLTERNITVEIAPDLPDVIADHARIREVMVNLIENAIRFLGNQPDPFIRIGVDESGEVPVFFVQDNGIGIASPYLERIFNLFEKLDASAPGTGIGLAIVRRIIEVHGGKVWAESDGPGKGTTFRFTLPGMKGEGLR